MIRVLSKLSAFAAMDEAQDFPTDYCVFVFEDKNVAGKYQKLLQNLKTYREPAKFKESLSSSAMSLANST